jgi:hypothetical protein
MNPTESITGPMTGQCLCGAVKFTAHGVPHEVGVCHWGMCRRWSGGPALAVEVESVALEGTENIAWFRSSDWAERGFCKTCGANLFYHIVDSSQYIIAAGAFDDQSGFEMTSQFFIDEKPGYYAFANQTRMMTGAEVFAMYVKPEPQE